MKRLDRSKYTLEDALNEIGFAEAILDGLGAKEGEFTLWGRIYSIKEHNNKSVQLTRRPLYEYAPGNPVVNRLIRLSEF